VPRPPSKSIFRSLGEFFGHVAHGVRTPVVRPPESITPPPAAPPERQVVRRTVEEEERATPHGPVTLRRTIIEEVELPPGARPGPPVPPAP
jgi:hypothetical protein